jgi:hypothetical protein
MVRSHPHRSERHCRLPGLSLIDSRRHLYADRERSAAQSARLADTLSGTQFYKVEAFDQFATGGRSASVQCAPISGQRLKDNPGMYFQIDYNQPLQNQYDQITYLANHTPHLTGVHLMWYPAMLDNPALVGGTAQYDGNWNNANDQTQINNLRGFKLFQKFLDHCTDLGLQMMMSIRIIGAGVQPGSQAVKFPSSYPAYYGNSTYGVNTAATTGLWGAVWINCSTDVKNTAVFAHYFRWWDTQATPILKALGAAYGAQFNSHQNVECVSWGCDELIADAFTGLTDAKHIAAVSGPNGINAAWRAAFPNTQIRNFESYITSTPNLDILLADAVSRYISIGGPDTANDIIYTSADPTLDSDGISRIITACRRWKGKDNSANGGVRDNTVPIYVRQGDYICEVEGEDLAYDANTDTTYNGNKRHIGDGVIQHILEEANQLGARKMVFYAAPSVPTSFVPRPNFPYCVYPTGPHPNLCDIVESIALGGINVGGYAVGDGLHNSAYPPTWPQ